MSENRNELITINYENVDRPTVSGRELHKALKIGTEYPKWFERMCEYGFTNEVDFNSVKNDEVRTEGSRTVKREIIDHQLTIPMAKEICMLQRSEKGKQFRQYFIKVEEAWNSPEMVMKRALEIANTKVKSLKTAIYDLNKQLESARSKVLFADAVQTSNSTILVGDLAKILKQNGIDMGQKRLFEWLRENGYLIKSGSSKNIPTQKSLNMGLFQIKESSILNPDGSIRVTKTTKVTGKGQQYFINKFLK